MIAEGLWDGGPTKWKITKDGILTITGEWGIAEADNYIWKDYAGVINKIVIDGDITTIPVNAFRGMTGVKSVQINAPVNTICQYAFADTGITAFTAPSSLRLIQRHAFEGCKAMQTLILEGGVETVEPEAFRDCAGIKHLVLGTSLKKIGDPVAPDHIFHSFEGCSGIETAEIYTDAFWSGFSGAKYLRSVVIGGNVRSICTEMFFGCSALTDVRITVPIEEIGGNAFELCSSLTSLEIPDTVTHIGVSAFYGTGLTRLTIPASVKEIGMYAFRKSALEEIVFLGDFPVNMNSFVFGGITVTAYYPADNETWNPDNLDDYNGTVTWVAQ